MLSRQAGGTDDHQIGFCAFTATVKTKDCPMRMIQPSSTQSVNKMFSVSSRSEASWRGQLTPVGLPNDHCRALDPVTSGRWPGFFRRLVAARGLVANHVVRSPVESPRNISSRGVCEPPFGTYIAKLHSKTIHLIFVSEVGRKGGDRLGGACEYAARQALFY